MVLNAQEKIENKGAKMNLTIEQKKELLSTIKTMKGADSVKIVNTYEYLWDSFGSFASITVELGFVFGKDYKMDIILERKNDNMKDLTKWEFYLNLNRGLKNNNYRINENGDYVIDYDLA